MGNLLGLEAPITDKDTERGEANGLRFAVSSMQGWRLRMEDEHTLVGRIPHAGLEDLSFFGVYDGHGGSFTSGYVGENIVGVFCRRKEVREYAALGAADRDDVPGVSLLKSALVNAFLDIDEEMRSGKILDGKLDRSGSTVVVVVVTPRHMICANAGDSRSCFRRGGVAKPLSFDHKPNEPVELSRITNAGGYVRMKRVDGDLAVSRALGDFQYKNRVHLPAELQKVTALPDVIVYPREIDKDEFLILACDGIWDVVSNQECVDMVQAILDEGERDLGSACEEMLDMCLEKRSRDNMTILIVSLPGVKANKAGGGGVAARRALRRAENNQGGAGEESNGQQRPATTNGVKGGN